VCGLRACSLCSFFKTQVRSSLRMAGTPETVLSQQQASPRSRIPRRASCIISGTGLRADLPFYKKWGMMKRLGTGSGDRFTRYRNARTLPEALAVEARDPAWRGSCKGGATKADLLYDYDHGLLLIGADAGGTVASAPGINGHLPAMSSRLFIAHAVNMNARKEAMAQTEIFIREELPRFFDQDDMQKAIAANQDKVSKVRA